MNAQRSEQSSPLDGLDLETFMHAAIAEAERAVEAGEVPIGAVLIVNGEIVSRGRARHLEFRSQLARAEMQALLGGGEDLWRDYDQAVLMTTRVPCPMCLGAAVMEDVRHIVYAVPDAIVHAAESITHNPSVARHIRTYRGGVLEDDVLAMQARFNRTYRRHDPATL
jgi:tRNA(Arg) A34 adenosine deaminase TadA